MSWIRERLESFGRQVAGIEGGREHAFAGLLKWMRRDASRIESGIGEVRSTLAVESDSTLGGLAAILAVAGTRHVALPAPIALTEAERAARYRIAGVRHILRTTPESSELIAVGSPEPHPLLERLNAPGLILFSSGTTGEPKAMLHDLGALLDRFRNGRPRRDRTLQLLLNDHIGGLDAAFRSLFAGSTLVVPEARRPEAAGRAIEAHRVNVLPASPTFLNLMLLEGVPSRYDCASVEIIAYGAEPMPEPLLRRLVEAFPNAVFQQKFGTSETGAIRIRSAANDSLFFRIDDPQTEWKVVDGELWLKTPSRILGYLNGDERSLEADGWYRTGDLVEEDDAGNLRVIGRETDWINVGGRKVHPSEIETAILEIPGVSACSACARPNALTGQSIHCELVVDDGDAQTWKRKIRSACRGRLAPWKLPATIGINGALSFNERLKRT